MIEVIEGSFSAGQNKDGLQDSFIKIQNVLKKEPFYLFSSMPHFALEEKSKKYKKEALWLYRLKEKVKEARKRAMGTLTIGGDHSIGMSTVAGVLEAQPDTAVLWIDAHADFNTYKSSITKNLHGMPLNAVLNGGKKTINRHFSWLKPLLTRKKLAIIGARDVDPLEKELLKEHNILCYWQEDIKKRGFSEIVDEAKQKLNPHNTSDYHISLDVDFLDPTEFAQTGLLIPNGFSLEDALFLLESFKPKSLDIVEWNSYLATDKDCKEKMLTLIDSFVENLQFYPEISNEDLYLLA